MQEQPLVVLPNIDLFLIKKIIDAYKIKSLDLHFTGKDSSLTFDHLAVKFTKSENDGMEGELTFPRLRRMNQVVPSYLNNKYQTFIGVEWVNIETFFYDVCTELIHSHLDNDWDYDEGGGGSLIIQNGEIIFSAYEYEEVVNEAESTLQFEITLSSLPDVVSKELATMFSDDAMTFKVNVDRYKYVESYLSKYKISDATHHWLFNTIEERAGVSVDADFDDKNDVDYGVYQASLYIDEGKVVLDSELYITKKQKNELIKIDVGFDAIDHKEFEPLSTATLMKLNDLVFIQSTNEDGSDLRRTLIAQNKYGEWIDINYNSSNFMNPVSEFLAAKYNALPVLDYVEDLILDIACYPENNFQINSYEDKASSWIRKMEAIIRSGGHHELWNGLTLLNVFESVSFQHEQWELSGVRLNLLQDKLYAAGADPFQLNEDNQTHMEFVVKHNKFTLFSTAELMVKHGISLQKARTSLVEKELKHYEDSADMWMRLELAQSSSILEAVYVENDIQEPVKLARLKL